MDELILALIDIIVFSQCIIWSRLWIMRVSDRGASIAQFKLIIKLRKMVHSRLHCYIYSELSGTIRVIVLKSMKLARGIESGS